MTSNVIPSAPESSIYPELPQHDFRMQKANEVSASLNAEVVHYRAVAKKYKRAKVAANWSAAGCGVFQLYFHLRVLHPLYQLQLQFHSAASEEHLLRLLLA